MFAPLLILSVILRANGQINGEFWWLNSNLNKIKKGLPEAPKIESFELHNNEGNNIVFKDNDGSNIKEYVKDNLIGIGEQVNKDVKQKDDIPMPWTTENDNRLTEDIIKSETPKTDKFVKGNEDLFQFFFPTDDNVIWTEPTVSTPVTASYNNTFNFMNEIMIFSEMKQETTTQSENICNLITTVECNKQRGFIISLNELYDSNVNQQTNADNDVICCVLPLEEDLTARIYFPDTIGEIKERFKRSNLDYANANHKQRDALLYRKYSTQGLKTKLPTQPTVTRKVVTPDYDDYTDPYWNIKNQNFKDQTNSYSDTKVESDEYVDDYTAELPRPGLLGLYSDHGPTNSDRYPYSTDSSEEDHTFGYSTIDPRRSPKPFRRGKPQKLSTADDEDSDSPETYTVSYNANPDFKVLEGFKIVLRNKNQFPKHSRKSTTERNLEDSEETSLNKPITESDSDAIDSEFSTDCGRSVKNSFKENKEDKQHGEADNGSHPWLALSVLTKRQQNILCYCTIIHSKVAITAADCVHGTAVGDVTIIAGLRHLNDSRTRTQQRIVKVHIHPQYKPGFLTHDLAILYWSRQLVFNTNVQPACLRNHIDGDDCMFFGWGGFEQVPRSKPRWQRASVLTSRGCNTRLSSSKRRVTLPGNAFCADVTTYNTVTGIGGPLICNIDNRYTAEGVVVWKENVVILIEAYDWATRAIKDLDL